MEYKIIGESDIENHKALNEFTKKCLKDMGSYIYESVNASTASIFSFSNENLEEIFKGRDLKGKRVLTVGSSGDQVLEAILHDCKDVTLIDANPLSQPYVELKLSAIKNLTYEEFLDCFSKSKLTLDAKYYSKISHDLTDYSKYFWDNIFLDLDINNIIDIKKYLFQLIGSVHDRDALSYVSEKTTYNSLKEKLDGCDITFKLSDFYNFHNDADGKYSLILLSNIFDYIPTENFCKEVKVLKENNLTRDGEIQIHYDFAGFTKSGEYDYNELTKYLHKKKLKTQNVPDIRTIEFATKYNTKRNDCTVIYF